MALFQRRRPTPIDVSVTRTKRQAAGLGAAGPGSSDAPKSPDSPGSSAGASSPNDSSDSEDDEPKSPESPKSPKKSSQSNTTSQAPPTTTPTATIASSSSKTKSPPSSPTKSSQPSSIATTTSSSSTAFTLVPTSQGIAAVAPPPVVTDPSTSTFTSIPTSKATSSRPSSTASPFTPSPPTSRSSQIFSSKIARPTQSASNTASGVPSRAPSISGIPVAEDDPPHRTHPEPPTLMSKGAEAAAITLSIMGAVIIAVCILLYCKRRRRRRAAKMDAELERDAANYVSSGPPTSGAGPNNGAHMTQISSRSNTLFGAGPYTRPETVSTNSHPSASAQNNLASIPLPQPTPNPFADPPLNKAYDVLAGRPRSTTLTDRGSWIKNPFKDPESERFDPFGELQAKARRERVKAVETARREAEREREREVERGWEVKDKMGLEVPQGVGRDQGRKGSGVTVEGLGVLDRSEGGVYR